MRNQTWDVVFLDIDGVLNSTRWYEKHGPFASLKTEETLDPNAIALLNQIVSREGVMVVISSSWRTISGGFQAVDRMLCERGFTGEVIGCTPMLMNGDRWKEVRDWLAQAGNMGFEVRKYIVIDDEMSFAEHDATQWFERTGGKFIPTVHVDGLTQLSVDMALEFLS